MWLEKGDVVTFIKSSQLRTGRIIRIPVGIPRAVVRYLSDATGYISENIHFDELRHATEEEQIKFLNEARKNNV